MTILVLLLIPVCVCLDTLSSGNPTPTGMMYVWRRHPEIRDGMGRLLDKAYWSIQQHSSIFFAPMQSGDTFGLSVAVDGYLAMGGASGDSRYGERSGAVYSIDTEYTNVGFMLEQQAIMENDNQGRVTVCISRSGDVSGSVTIHYSTRDITAFGVTERRFDECLAMPFQNRGINGCGDYQHRQGEVSPPRTPPPFLQHQLKSKTNAYTCWLCHTD